MKQFVVTLLLLFVLVPQAFAASVHDKTVTDMESRYKKTSSWRADFEQTSYIEVLEQNLTKSGRITVSRPDKLRIEYLSEPHKIYISNGKTLWVYQPEAKSAQQFDNPERIISKEALGFLSGLANLSLLFDVLEGVKEPAENLKIEDTKLKKITLIPKDQDSPILRLTLGIDLKNLTLKEAVLFNASGNVTHYAFRDIAFDGKISENDFSLPEGGKIKITKK